MKKPKGSLLLWLAPLFFAMLMAPPAAAANQPVPLKYQEYTVLEMGDILFGTPRGPKQKLLSSGLLLKGKVLRSPRLKSDEIVVYRMVITCCAADALPLGIVVKLPTGIRFRDGVWVGVAGTIQLRPFDPRLKFIEPVANMVPQEKLCAYFTAAKAYPVNAPREEYLYVQYSY